MRASVIVFPGSNCDRDAAVAAMSDEMVQSIDFMGDHDEVAAFFASHRAAGIEHPVLMALPWGDDRWAVTEATMRAAADGS